MKFTQEHINLEFNRIHNGMGEPLTYEQYIRTSRVGEPFRMSRADRKEMYTLYLNRAIKKGVSISKRGQAAYDAICLERDGCL